jgi:GNAT superfamily N-acetyltransferase
VKPSLYHSAPARIVDYNRRMIREPIALRVAAAEAESADMAAMTRIRTSVSENLLSVEQLSELGITAESVAALLRTTGRGWIASLGGVDAGFAIADAAEATIYGMFVLPSHEGRGIGRRLMAEAEAWLFAAGCAELWLGTDADPAVRAHGFYRRLGWIADGETLGIDGMPEIRYIKRRTP